MLKIISLVLLVYFSSYPISSFTQSITLFGTTQDSTITNVSILEPELFLWNFTKPVRHQSEMDQKKFVLKLEEKDGHLYYFSFIGYQTLIFVNPGDSIQFEIKRDSLGSLTVEFSGSNEENYNYYAKLSSIFKGHGPFYKGNIELFKNEVTARINKKRQFHEGYWKAHPRSEFRDLTLAEIAFEEYYLLLRPFGQSQLKLSEMPEKYLPQFPLGDDKYLVSEDYRAALRSKYIFSATDDMWNNFDFIFDGILKNTSGAAKDFLVTTVLGLYAREQMVSYKESLLNAFDLTRSNFSPYADVNEKSRNAYLILDHPLPTAVLESTWVTEPGTNKTNTLKQVLEKYKSKPLYLDFWASWCSPCRLDIKESKKSKHFLDSLGVAVIYLSIDKENSSWIKAAQDENILENQFLINEGKSSALGKFIDLQFIPRYVILDKNHNVKDTNAPRLNPDHYSKLVESVKSIGRGIVKVD